MPPSLTPTDKSNVGRLLSLASALGLDYGVLSYVFSDSSSSVTALSCLLFLCAVVILVPHSVATSVYGVPPHCCSAVYDVVPPPLEGGGGALAYGCSRVTGGLPQTYNTSDLYFVIPLSMVWVPRASRAVPGPVLLVIGGYSLPSSSLFLFLSDTLPYSIFWVTRSPHRVPIPVALVVG